MTDSTHKRILVLNLGSSSIKFALFESDGTSFSRLATGLFERIGEPDSEVHYSSRVRSGTLRRSFPTHEEGMEFLDELLITYCGVISDPSQIDAVGHRVVHGGDKIVQPSIVDENVIAAIMHFEAFAPLHNPVNLKGIRKAMQIFSDKPQVAVFDTAFHGTIPDKARVYGLHYKHFLDGVKKYGFHGTSHHYVALEAARLLGKPLAEVNLITCHLGNGSSIAAIQRGKSIETSMGLTPLEGLIMGTRCGDIDPAAIFHIMRNADFTPDEMEGWLNKESGMYALAGSHTPDMRRIWESADDGNRWARLALEAFAHRVGRYIGASIWYLNGDFHIVFTGGIGENDWRTRELILEGHEGNGIILDKRANKACEAVITTPDSPRKAFVIHTDEELMIAKYTCELIAAGTPAAEKQSV